MHLLCATTDEQFSEQRGPSKPKRCPQSVKALGTIMNDNEWLDQIGTAK